MKNIAIVMYMGPTGLGVLRSLGKQGIRAYGLDWNPDAPGFYSKFCERKLVFPNPLEDSDKFVCQLIELAKQQERPMILMPAADYYVSLISRHAEELSGLFLFNIPKPAILESIVDKNSQFELAKANDIPAPGTFSPASINELDAHEKSLHFPMLVKGAVADQWQTVFKERGLSLFNRRLYFWDRIYRTKNLYITHYSAAHFRNRQQKALESFLRGLEHEDKTGTFPDRVV